MKFHFKCPHCGVMGEAELHLLGQAVGAIDTLSTNRSQEAIHYSVRCDGLDGCGAGFAVSFEVHEQPIVATLPTYDLLQLQKKAKLLAPQIRKVKRTHVHKTPPPVNCPGCGREFGEMQGYPEPLPTRGLCAVCSQELERQIAVRQARRR